MPRASAADAARTREQIVTATADAASTNGFRGVSTRAVARDLHLSSAGVLGPFSSREGLLAEALEQALQAFAAAIVVPTHGTAPGRPRLLAVVDCWVDYLADCPFPGGCVVTAASVDLDGHPGALRDRLAAGLTQWHSFLSDQFRAAGVPPTSARDAAIALGGVAMAVNQDVQLLDQSATDAAARGRRMMRLVIDAACGDLGV